MNKRQKAKKIASEIHKISSILVIVFATFVVAMMLILWAMSFLESAPPFLVNVIAIPMIFLAYAAGSAGIVLGSVPIPVGLVSIAAWVLNPIEERPKGMKQVFLFFLPTIICIVFAVALSAGFFAP